MKQKKIIMILSVVFVTLFSAFTAGAYTADSVRVATWNIEHLGSPGRGLSGIGSRSLPPRTDEQLKQIALLIRDELALDLVAVQEVAVTHEINGVRQSRQLDKIVGFLGSNWKYHIGASGLETIDPVSNMHCAFLWNTSVIHNIKMMDFIFPNEIVGDKNLFDRRPLAGYFEIMINNTARNDFLITNVHLTSGQENDENHLAAMVILEQNMKHLLNDNGVKESDRIILGDFNDNPYAVKSDGSPEYINTLYEYMSLRKYTDLVTAQTGATRMDDNLTSIIDHILINNSAAYHLAKTPLQKYMPGTDIAVLAKWRETFSDHFPLIFEIKIAAKDDDVD